MKNFISPVNGVSLGRMVKKMYSTKSANIKKTIWLIFEMAAMPFLYNGILIIQGNLPRVLPELISNMLVVLSPILIHS